jgi:hypothetical protein
VFIKADEANKLTKAQKHIAAQARILFDGLADVGIVALVDEATGYQNVRPRDALQAYLDKILRRELAAWSKKFPDEFYINIYRLKGWKWPGMSTNRYSVCAHYTLDLIYDRLAPGVREELERRSPKDETGRRRGKLHQWLGDDYGHPMLAQHMHAVIMFQRYAIQTGQNWGQFMTMMNQVMPKKGSTLELPFNGPATGLLPPFSPPPSASPPSLVQ